ncbi:hypothetical protein B0T22DRAFT_476968 [Podospora appendiculata]|uniref:Apple domain-containing protein n=1 Tax=Podospora appendiculata TaxID=314037 RepID=A0AAE0XJ40_9PEZI|nr:hypothetical protein B0T22DRAFT_476968 [Podospora appendiculata]
MDPLQLQQGSSSSQLPPQLHPQQPQPQPQAQSQPQPLYLHHIVHNNPPRVRFAEENSEHSHVVYHPEQASLDPRDQPAAPPAVYWADDRDTDDASSNVVANHHQHHHNNRSNNNDDDANLDQYTFYREGTPPPPEHERDQEKGYGLGRGLDGPGEAGSSSYASHGHEYGAGSTRHFPPLDGAAPSDWSNASSYVGIFGIRRRRVFWAIVAGGLLLLFALALGVGLGVGLSKKESSAETLSPTTSSSPATSPDTASTSSTTTTSATNSSTPILSTAPYSSVPTGGATLNSDCPGSNGTVYTVPSSTKTFLRVCGIDYSGVGGAVDIAHVVTSSMDECMNACAARDDCTGCAWGYIFGDSGNAHRCWMKNSLQTAHNATHDWSFAVLQ